jgi:hypothetical protein
MLAKIEKLPNRKALLEEGPSAILIVDASEQRIERPVKGQKDFYSGEKKATRLRRNSSFAR